MPTAAFQAILGRTSLLGGGKETTEGSPISATFFQPADTIKPEDARGFDDDTSMVGNAAKTQGLVPTVNDTTFDIDGKCYWENIGNFLVAAGWADAVSSGRTTSADGHTTTTSAVITAADAAFTTADIGGVISGTGIPAATTIISVQSATSATMSANATATASTVVFTIGTVGTTRHNPRLASSEPPSYTWTDFNGFNTRQWAGSQLDSLDLTIDAKAAVKVSTAWKGYPSVVGSKPTAVYPALVPMSGYQAVYTLNGAAETRVQTLTLSIKRNAESIHTSTGNQAPSSTFSGEAEVTGKITLAYVDDTELLLLLNNTEPVLLVTLASPSGSPAPTFTIILSQCGFKKGTVDRSGKYATISFDIEAIVNATDGGPCQFIITNGITTAY